MYHSVAEEDEAGVRPYFRTATAPLTFRAQMQCLFENEYRTCTLPQALNMLSSPAGTSDKYAVITFDDGYQNFESHAFPALAQFGFTATVFLATAFVGDNTARQFKGRNCLTWPQVRGLLKLGIHFGSHTETHPQLRKLGREAIDRELTSSKKRIEDKTGCLASSFAYPYAFPQTDAGFREQMRQSLRKAGYDVGVCTTVGRAGGGSDRFFLERLPINGCDDARLLQAKLMGAYDWVGAAQSLIKTLNRS
jgi:peptidoglycan/xylan/chitin deacetylase (PgdA/CDA1 family)